MRHFRIVLLGLMFSSLPARGEDGEAKWSALRQRMQEFVDRGEIAGAVTVVGQRRGIVNLETVGWRDLDERAPMERETLFRIASMTKPITAIGIMMLAEDGKLRIDDPVERHLPEFADPWMVAERLPDRLTLRRPRRPISIKDLMTHTSGLPSGMPVGLADLYRRRNRTLAEAVMAISQRPLEFEPGSRWSYSNAGIDVLGRIIEVASGQRYEDFLQARLFDPLGMKDTTFYPTREQTKRLATTYEIRDGQLRANPGTLMDLPADARHPIPAAGLYSTAVDLAALYTMMLNEGQAGSRRILSKESVRAMTQNQIGGMSGAFTPGMGFGLGWAVVRQPQGVTASLSPGSYGHGGAFGTQGWIDPQKDFFVLLLIQRVGLPNADGSPMRQALQEAAVAALK